MCLVLDASEWGLPLPQQGWHTSVSAQLSIDLAGKPLHACGHKQQPGAMSHKSAPSALTWCKEGVACEKSQSLDFLVERGPVRAPVLGDHDKAGGCQRGLPAAATHPEPEVALIGKAPGACVQAPDVASRGRRELVGQQEAALRQLPRQVCERACTEKALQM